jgi:intracellular sulfur oxidation DsrE/DsrF family protein
MKTLTRRATLALAALSGFAASAAATTAARAAASGRYGKQKVVYHINYDGGDADKAYRAAMQNIQNHINAVGAENLEVRVVMHGNGVGMLKSAVGNESLRNQIVGLKGQNVGFQVCNNTLVGRKIDYENDLFGVWEEDIVPSGVAELSHLQQQGYTYIKP